MMRIGFLPSDFNPMILMLGEAEDCRALGGVLRRFAREGQDVALRDLGFCRVADVDVVLTAAPGAGGYASVRSWSFHLARAAGHGGTFRRSAGRSGGAGAGGRVGGTGLRYR